MVLNPCDAKKNVASLNIPKILSFFKFCQYDLHYLPEIYQWSIGIFRFSSFSGVFFGKLLFKILTSLCLQFIWVELNKVIPYISSVSLIMLFRTVLLLCIHFFPLFFGISKLVFIIHVSVPKNCLGFIFQFYLFLFSHSIHRFLFLSFLSLIFLLGFYCCFSEELIWHCLYI